METAKPFVDRKRMTNLAEAVANKLRSAGRPVVADVEIIRAMEEVYGEGKVRYLRGDRPTLGAVDRSRSILKAEKFIGRDADYRRFWRVNTVPDRSADEIVCLVDQTVYISHLSAMQTYGLTNRRPTDLYLTRSDDAYWRTTRAEILQRSPEYDEFGFKLLRTHHPSSVRGRRLSTLSTKCFGRFTQLRNSFARISSIGQTFYDMLSSPELCGGMPHVLDVFEDHAPKYLEEIIENVDEGESQIVKVRAGYILEERLGVRDGKVQKWTSFAQRGGSRILDPQKPFSPAHSEKWMISINV
jgi:predicted transcriptional regulator of viral defense system